MNKYIILSNEVDKQRLIPSFVLLMYSVQTPLQRPIIWNDHFNRNLRLVRAYVEII